MSEEILEKKDRIYPASFDDSWRFPNSSSSEIPEKCHFTDWVCEPFIVRKPSIFLCQKEVVRTRSRQVLATKKTRPLFSENY